MIRAILFDIDNTLYCYDAANEKAMKKVYFYCRENFDWDEPLTRQRLKEAQEEVRRVLPLPGAALHNRLIRYQLMLEKYREPLFPHAQKLCHAYWDELIKVMEAEPGVIELFERIKKNKMQIGIATDMTAYMQYKKLEKLKLSSYVDFIVSSEEAGVEKPNPKIFLRCAQKAGCEPRECLMIGDSLQKDVLGAMKVGMKSLLYQMRDDSRLYRRRVTNSYQWEKSFSSDKRSARMHGDSDRKKFADANPNRMPRLAGASLDCPAYKNPENMRAAESEIKILNHYKDFEVCCEQAGWKLNK